MTFGQRLAAMQLAQRESEIRQAIARERRPVFGTGKMRRVSRCILLASAAMFRGTLPAGSVVVVADAYGSEGWHRGPAHPPRLG